MKYELKIECSDECRVVVGSKTKMVKELRKEWRATRRKERCRLGLDDGANELSKNIHDAKLITSSSAEIETTGMIDLMRGLNAYGMKKYNLKTL